MNLRSFAARLLVIATLLSLVAGIDPCFVRVLAGDRAMACALGTGAAPAPVRSHAMHACCAKARAAHSGRTAARHDCCSLDGVATSPFVATATPVHAPAPTAHAILVAALSPFRAASPAVRWPVPADEGPPRDGVSSRRFGRAPPLA